MDESREELLRLFFDHHGLLANQDIIYKENIIDYVTRDKTRIAKFPDITDDDQYIINTVQMRNNITPFPELNESKYIRSRSNYNVEFRGVESRDKLKTKIYQESFEMPLMTPDGYFIIQGVEKAPLIQEYKSRNTMFYSVNGESIIAETRLRGCRNTLKMAYESQITIQLLMDKGEKSGPIPSITINDLFKTWYQEGEIRPIDIAVNLVKGTARQFEVFSALTSSMSNDIIDTEEYEYFTDYVMGSASRKEVVLTLTHMIYKCVSIKFGDILPTDRDDYGYKIFHSSGAVLGKLMRRALNRVAGKLESKIDDLVYSPMKTGSIEINNTIKNKMVVQVGKRSRLDTISSVRRVVVPADDNSTADAMRQINITQHGYICPTETPEGKQVGLIKTLAMTCIISSTTYIDEEYFQHYIIDIQSGPVLICNGTVLGFVDPMSYTRIRSLKIIHPFLSVNMDNGNIYIRTWEGRLMRPLIRTNREVFSWNIIKNKTWENLLSEGVIEYVDPIELQSLEICSRSYNGYPQNYTHMELAPYTMFGISASTIPYINHNQGARGIFASSMVKQAMESSEALNNHLHSDGKFLIYGQRSLVSTGNNINNLNPNGVNVLVCIMSYGGYNQEDAIIVNKNFADYGGFSSINGKVKRIDNSTGDRKFIFSDEGSNKIDLSREADPLKRDIWIVDGTTDKTTIKTQSDIKISDTELYYRNHRLLRMGDKIASRHAQKGVIGCIMPKEDMPFTEDGMTPDIIINPHGIPSRMTMGQILEGVTGRKCAIKGTFADGTPFGKYKLEEFGEDSVEFTSGIDGEIMYSYGSIHLVYYMPLTHQALDKIYIRATGPRSELSRQPVSGKTNEGGLRFGEMEQDLLIARGCSSIIQDVSKNSDMTNFEVCSSCGNFPVQSKKCLLCASTKITRLEMPYSIKVLKDMLIASNLDLRIIPK